MADLEGLQWCDGRQGRIQRVYHAGRQGRIQRVYLGMLEDRGGGV